MNKMSVANAGETPLPLSSKITAIPTILVPLTPLITGNLCAEEGSALAPDTTTTKVSTSKDIRDTSRNSDSGKSSSCSPTLLDCSFDSGIAGVLLDANDMQRHKRIQMCQRILLALERDREHYSSIRNRLSKVTERRNKKVVETECLCNVCCAEIDPKNKNTYVKCSICQKHICRSIKCADWLAKTAQWECELCQTSKESLAQTSSWVADQLSFNQQKLVYPMRARSEIFIPISECNDSSINFESVSQIGANNPLITAEQRLKIREYVEEIVSSLLGGNLDKISVNQLSRSENYFYLFYKYHSKLSNIFLSLENVLTSRILQRGDLPAPKTNGHHHHQHFATANGSIGSRHNGNGAVVGAALNSRESTPGPDFTDVSEARLRNMIQKIIAETVNMAPLTKSYAVSEIALDRPSKLSEHMGFASNGLRHRTEHYFEPTIYQDLLATAVLNKIVDKQSNNNHNTNHNMSESSPDLTGVHRVEGGGLPDDTPPAGLDQNYNIENQSITSGSSIEPRSDCSYTDTEPINTTTDDKSPEFILDAGRDSALSDYIAAHMVPLPNLSTMATESEEDDHMSVTSSAVGDSTWENNWLFKKKKSTVSSSLGGSSVGMLVPDPKEDVRAQIGDKTADEISDLSELGSDTDDSSLELLRSNVDPINDRLFNKHLIGGQNSKMVLDELIERSSMTSNTLPTDQEHPYTETCNENVEAPVRTEAINSSVTQQTNNNNNNNEENQKNLEAVPPAEGFDDSSSNPLTAGDGSESNYEGCVGFGQIEVMDTPMRTPSVIELLAAIALGPMIAVPAADDPAPLTASELNTLTELRDLALNEVKCRSMELMSHSLGVIPEEVGEFDLKTFPTPDEMEEERVSSIPNPIEVVTDDVRTCESSNSGQHTQFVSQSEKQETTLETLERSDSVTGPTQQNANITAVDVTCLVTAPAEVLKLSEHLAENKVSEPGKSIVSETVTSVEPVNIAESIYPSVTSNQTSDKVVDLSKELDAPGSNVEKQEDKVTEMDITTKIESSASDPDDQIVAIEPTPTCTEPELKTNNSTEVMQEQIGSDMSSEIQGSINDQTVSAPMTMAPDAELVVVEEHTGADLVSNKETGCTSDSKVPESIETSVSKVPESIETSDSKVPESIETFEQSTPDNAASQIESDVASHALEKAASIQQEHNDRKIDSTSDSKIFEVTETFEQSARDSASAEIEVTNKSAPNTPGAPTQSLVDQSDSQETASGSVKQEEGGFISKQIQDDQINAQAEASGEIIKLTGQKGQRQKTIEISVAEAVSAVSTMANTSVEHITQEESQESVTKRELSIASDSVLTDKAEEQQTPKIESEIQKPNELIDISTETVMIIAPPPSISPEIIKTGEEKDKPESNIQISSSEIQPVSETTKEMEKTEGNIVNECPKMEEEAPSAGQVPKETSIHETGSVSDPLQLKAAEIDEPNQAVEIAPTEGTIRPTDIPVESTSDMVVTETILPEIRAKTSSEVNQTTEEIMKENVADEGTHFQEDKTIVESKYETSSRSASELVSVPLESTATYEDLFTDTDQGKDKPKQLIYASANEALSTTEGPSEVRPESVLTEQAQPDIPLETPTNTVAAAAANLRKDKTNKATESSDILPTIDPQQESSSEIITTEVISETDNISKVPKETVERFETPMSVSVPAEDLTSDSASQIITAMASTSLHNETAAPIISAKETTNAVATPEITFGNQSNNEITSIQVGQVQVATAYHSELSKTAEEIPSTEQTLTITVMTDVPSADKLVTSSVEITKSTDSVTQDSPEVIRIVEELNLSQKNDVALQDISIEEQPGESKEEASDSNIEASAAGSEADINSDQPPATQETPVIKNDKESEPSEVVTHEETKSMNVLGMDSIGQQCIVISTSESFASSTPAAEENISPQNKSNITEIITNAFQNVPGPSVEVVSVVNEQTLASQAGNSCSEGIHIKAPHAETITNSLAEPDATEKTPNFDENVESQSTPLPVQGQESDNESEYLAPTQMSSSVPEHLDDITDLGDLNNNFTAGAIQSLLEDHEHLESDPVTDLAEKSQNIETENTNEPAINTDTLPVPEAKESKNENDVACGEIQSGADETPVATDTSFSTENLECIGRPDSAVATALSTSSTTDKTSKKVHFDEGAPKIARKPAAPMNNLTGEISSILCSKTANTNAPIDIESNDVIIPPPRQFSLDESDYEVEENIALHESAGEHMENHMVNSLESAADISVIPQDILAMITEINRNTDVAEVHMPKGDQEEETSSENPSQSNQMDLSQGEPVLESETSNVSAKESQIELATEPNATSCETDTPTVEKAVITVETEANSAQSLKNDGAEAKSSNLEVSGDSICAIQSPECLSPAETIEAAKSITTESMGEIKSEFYSSTAEVTEDPITVDGVQEKILDTIASQINSEQAEIAKEGETNGSNVAHLPEVPMEQPKQKQNDDSVVENTSGVISASQSVGTEVESIGASDMFSASREGITTEPTACVTMESIKETTPIVPEGTSNTTAKERMAVAVDKEKDDISKETPKTASSAEVPELPKTSAADSLNSAVPSVNVEQFGEDLSNTIVGESSAHAVPTSELGNVDDAKTEQTEKVIENGNHDSNASDEKIAATTTSESKIVKEQIDLTESPATEEAKSLEVVTPLETAEMTKVKNEQTEEAEKSTTEEVKTSELATQSGTVEVAEDSTETVPLQTSLKSDVEDNNEVTVIGNSDTNSELSENSPKLELDEELVVVPAGEVSVMQTAALESKLENEGTNIAKGSTRQETNAIETSISIASLGSGETEQPITLKRTLEEEDTNTPAEADVEIRLAINESLINTATNSEVLEYPKVEQKESVHKPEDNANSELKLENEKTIPAEESATLVENTSETSEITEVTAKTRETVPVIESPNLELNKILSADQNEAVPREDENILTMTTCQTINENDQKNLMQPEQPEPTALTVSAAQIEAAQVPQDSAETAESISLETNVEEDNTKTSLDIVTKEPGDINVSTADMHDNINTMATPETKDENEQRTLTEDSASQQLNTVTVTHIIPPQLSEESSSTVRPTPCVKEDNGNASLDKDMKGATEITASKVEAIEKVEKPDNESAEKDRIAEDLGVDKSEATPKSDDVTGSLNTEKGVENEQSDSAEEPSEPHQDSTKAVLPTSDVVESSTKVLATKEHLHINETKDEGLQLESNATKMDEELPVDPSNTVTTIISESNDESEPRDSARNSVEQKSNTFETPELVIQVECAKVSQDSSEIKPEIKEPQEIAVGNQTFEQKTSEQKTMEHSAPTDGGSQSKSILEQNDSMDTIKPLSAESILVKDQRELAEENNPEMETPLPSDKTTAAPIKTESTSSTTQSETEKAETSIIETPENAVKIENPPVTTEPPSSEVVETLVKAYGAKQDDDSELKSVSKEVLEESSPTADESVEVPISETLPSTAMPQGTELLVKEEQTISSDYPDNSIKAVTLDFSCVETDVLETPAVAKTEMPSTSQETENTLSIEADHGARVPMPENTSPKGMKSECKTVQSELQLSEAKLGKGNGVEAFENEAASVDIPGEQKPQQDMQNKTENSKTSEPQSCEQISSTANAVVEFPSPKEHLEGSPSDTVTTSDEVSGNILRLEISDTQTISNCTESVTESSLPKYNLAAAASVEPSGVEGSSSLKQDEATQSNQIRESETTSEREYTTSVTIDLTEDSHAEKIDSTSSENLNKSSSSQCPQAEATETKIALAIKTADSAAKRVTVASENKLPDLSAVPSEPLDMAVVHPIGTTGVQDNQTLENEEKDNHLSADHTTEFITDLTNTVSVISECNDSSNAVYLLVEGELSEETSFIISENRESSAKELEVPPSDESCPADAVSDDAIPSSIEIVSGSVSLAEELAAAMKIHSIESVVLDTRLAEKLPNDVQMQPIPLEHNSVLMTESIPNSGLANSQLCSTSNIVEAVEQLCSTPETDGSFTKTGIESSPLSNETDKSLQSISETISDKISTVTADLSNENEVSVEPPITKDSSTMLDETLATVPDPVETTNTNNPNNSNEATSLENEPEISSNPMKEAWLPLTPILSVTPFDSKTIPPTSDIAAALPTPHTSEISETFQPHESDIILPTNDTIKDGTSAQTQDSNSSNTTAEITSGVTPSGIPTPAPSSITLDHSTTTEPDHIPSPTDKELNSQSNIQPAANPTVTSLAIVDMEHQAETSSPVLSAAITNECSPAVSLTKECITETVQTPTVTEEDTTTSSPIKSDMTPQPETSSPIISTTITTECSTAASVTNESIPESVPTEIVTADVIPTVSEEDTNDLKPEPETSSPIEAAAIKTECFTAASVKNESTTESVPTEIVEAEAVPTVSEEDTTTASQIQTNLKLAPETYPPIISAAISTECSTAASVTNESITESVQTEIKLEPETSLPVVSAAITNECSTADSVTDEYVTESVQAPAEIVTAEAVPTVSDEDTTTSLAVHTDLKPKPETSPPTVSAAISNECSTTASVTNESITESVQTATEIVTAEAVPTVSGEDIVTSLQIQTALKPEPETSTPIEAAAITTECSTAASVTNESVTQSVQTATEIATAEAVPTVSGEDIVTSLQIQTALKPEPETSPPIVAAAITTECSTADSVTNESITESVQIATEVVTAEAVPTASGGDIATSLQVQTDLKLEPETSPPIVAAAITTECSTAASVTNESTTESVQTATEIVTAEALPTVSEEDTTTSSAVHTDLKPEPETSPPIEATAITTECSTAASVTNESITESVQIATEVVTAEAVPTVSGGDIATYFQIQTTLKPEPETSPPIVAAAITTECSTADSVTNESITESVQIATEVVTAEAVPTASGGDIATSLQVQTDLKLEPETSPPIVAAAITTECSTAASVTNESTTESVQTPIEIVTAEAVPTVSEEDTTTSSAVHTDLKPEPETSPPIEATAITTECSTAASVTNESTTESVQTATEIVTAEPVPTVSKEDTTTASQIQTALKSEPETSPSIVAAAIITECSTAASVTNESTTESVQTATEIVTAVPVPTVSEDDTTTSSAVHTDHKPKPETSPPIVSAAITTECSTAASVTNESTTESVQTPIEIVTAEAVPTVSGEDIVTSLQIQTALKPEPETSPPIEAAAITTECSTAASVTNESVTQSVQTATEIATAEAVPTVSGEDIVTSLQIQTALKPEPETSPPIVAAAITTECSTADSVTNESITESVQIATEVVTAEALPTVSEEDTTTSSAVHTDLKPEPETSPPIEAAAITTECSTADSVTNESITESVQIATEVVTAEAVPTVSGGDIATSLQIQTTLKPEPETSPPIVAAAITTECSTAASVTNESTTESVQTATEIVTAEPVPTVSEDDTTTSSAVHTDHKPKSETSPPIVSAAITTECSTVASVTNESTTESVQTVTEIVTAEAVPTVSEDDTTTSSAVHTDLKPKPETSPPIVSAAITTECSTVALVTNESTTESVQTVTEIATAEAVPTVSGEDIVTSLQIQTALKPEPETSPPIVSAAITTECSTADSVTNESITESVQIATEVVTAEAVPTVSGEDIATSLQIQTTLKPEPETSPPIVAAAITTECSTVTLVTNESTTESVQTVTEIVTAEAVPTVSEDDTTTSSVVHTDLKPEPETSPPIVSAAITTECSTVTLVTNESTTESVQTVTEIVTAEAVPTVSEDDTTTSSAVHTDHKPKPETSPPIVSAAITTECSTVASVTNESTAESVQTVTEIVTAEAVPTVSEEDTTTSPAVHTDLKPKPETSPPIVSADITTECSTAASVTNESTTESVQTVTEIATAEAVPTVSGEDIVTSLQIQTALKPEPETSPPIVSAAITTECSTADSVTNESITESVQIATEVVTAEAVPTVSGEDIATSLQIQTTLKPKPETSPSAVSAAITNECSTTASVTNESTTESVQAPAEIVTAEAVSTVSEEDTTTSPAVHTDLKPKPETSPPKISAAITTECSTVTLVTNESTTESVQTVTEIVTAEAVPTVSEDDTTTSSAVHTDLKPKPETSPPIVSADITTECSTAASVTNESTTESVQTATEIVTAEAVSTVSEEDTTTSPAVHTDLKLEPETYPPIVAAAITTECSTAVSITNASVTSVNLLDESKTCENNVPSITPRLPSNEIEILVEPMSQIVTKDPPDSNVCQNVTISSDKQQIDLKNPMATQTNAKIIESPIPLSHPNVSNSESPSHRISPSDSLTVHLTQTISKEITIEQNAALSTKLPAVQIPISKDTNVTCSRALETERKLPTDTKTSKKLIIPCDLSYEKVPEEIISPDQVKNKPTQLQSINESESEPTTSLSISEPKSVSSDLEPLNVSSKEPSSTQTSTSVPKCFEEFTPRTDTSSVNADKNALHTNSTSVPDTTMSSTEPINKTEIASEPAQDTKLTDCSTPIPHLSPSATPASDLVLMSLSAESDVQKSEDSTPVSIDISSLKSDTNDTSIHSDLTKSADNSSFLITSQSTILEIEILPEATDGAIAMDDVCGATTETTVQRIGNKSNLRKLQRQYGLEYTTPSFEDVSQSQSSLTSPSPTSPSTSTLTPTPTPTPARNPANSLADLCQKYINDKHLLAALESRRRQTLLMHRYLSTIDSFHSSDGDSMEAASDTHTEVLLQPITTNASGQVVVPPASVFESCSSSSTCSSSSPPPVAKAQSCPEHSSSDWEDCSSDSRSFVLNENYTVSYDFINKILFSDQISAHVDHSHADMLSRVTTVEEFCDNSDDDKDTLVNKKIKMKKKLRRTTNNVAATFSDTPATRVSTITDNRVPLTAIRKRTNSNRPTTQPATTTHTNTTNNKTKTSNALTNNFECTRQTETSAAAHKVGQQHGNVARKESANEVSLSEDEEDDEVGILPRFVPGSIAEREYMKWYNAVEMPNNPYAPEALKRRISGGQERFIDLPKIPATVEQSPLDLIAKDKLDADDSNQRDSEIKRYSRDYYINESSKQSQHMPQDADATKEATTTETSEQQPHLQQQQPTSTSTPVPAHETQTNAVAKQTDPTAVTLDLYTAMPAQVVDDQTSSLDTMSQKSMQSANTTTSDDSDTVKIYNFKKQETTIIKETKEMSCEQKAQDHEKDKPADKAKEPPTNLTFKEGGGSAVSSTVTSPTRGSTPEAFKFLQPKRKLLDPTQVLSVDEDEPEIPCGSKEKPVIEKEVRKALPSVKALAKAFLMTSSSLQHSSAKISWPRKAKTLPEKLLQTTPTAPTDEKSEEDATIASDLSSLETDSLSVSQQTKDKTNDQPALTQVTTAGMPGSPVPVRQGVLKSNIAFFENLKNLK